jgi:drug resistance transporter emrB/qacA subfamily protein
LVSHLSLSATGLAMTSFAIGSAFLAYAGKIVDQRGGGAVTVAGSYGLLVVAIAQLAGTRASSQPWWTIVALLLLSGITLSSIIVPSATAAYAKINKPDVPDAVALNNLLLRVGGAVGSAVIIQLSLRDQSGAGQLVAIYLLLLAIAVAVAAQLLRQSTPYRRN